MRKDDGAVVEGSRRGTDLILDVTLALMWRGSFQAPEVRSCPAATNVIAKAGVLILYNQYKIMCETETYFV